MKDSRELRIVVGPVISRVEGVPPTRELFEAFAVWERGTGRDVFPCYRLDNTFFTGLLPEVVALLESQGIAVTVDDARRRPSPSRRWTLRGATPHDYQRRIADRLSERALLLARLSSAGGKSVAALAAIRATGVERALYVTDRLDLAFQFEEVAREHLGIAPGFVGAGRFAVDAPLVVASVDSALARADELGPFGLTIADEAHSAAASRYFELLGKVGSYYRLGLTATPFRSRREEDLLLRALFGRPVEIAALDELERGGFVARPRLRTIPVAGSIELTLVWRDLEEALVDCATRNDLIVRESLRLAAEGQNTLVLLRLIRHGMILRDRFRAAGRDVPLVTGGMPAAERHDVVRGLRTSRGAIVIGTEVLAVGVDMPTLGGLVLACGMHAKVPTLQKVGRAMRVSPDAPSRVKTVVDFDDAMHPTLARHSLARRKWLTEILGLKQEASP